MIVEDNDWYYVIIALSSEVPTVFKFSTSLLFIYTATVDSKPIFQLHENSQEYP